MSPTVKVEIQFSGSTWTDVSAWLASSASITRGRANESGQIDAGTCSVVLTNNDGRFSPGLASGAYYPNVIQGKRLRVSVQVDGDWYTRFTGYIEAWSVGGWDETTLTAVCTVTAVDASGFMSEPLKQTVTEILEAAGAIAYWPLTESEGPVYSNLLGTLPALVERTVGTAGTIENGAGPTLGADGGGAGLTSAYVSDTKGTLLTLAQSVPVGSAFTIGFVASLSGQGPVWCLSKGERILQYGCDDQSGVKVAELRDIEPASGSFNQGSNQADGVPLVEMVSVSATTTYQYSRGTTVGNPHSSYSSLDGGTFVVLGGRLNIDTLAAGQWLNPSLGIGHIFILPSALSMAEMGTLAGLLDGTLTDSADDRIETALGWVGESTAVAYLGGQTNVVALPTEGVTVAELADTYAQGTASRFLIARDGTPTWIDRSYRPAPVTVSAALVNPDGYVYATDTSAYLSECTTTLADGGSYTYTRTAPIKRVSASLTGVHPDDNLNQSVAQWLVNTSSGDPRIPSATIDVLTLPAVTDQEAVAALDVASRLVISDLPAQIPDDLAVIVEGYTETLGPVEWSLTLNLSPDPFGSVFILDDSLLDTDGDVLAI